MKYVTVVLIVFAIWFAFDTIAGLAAEFEEHDQDSLSGSIAQVVPDPEPVYHSMIATAYCLKGLTATETQARPGIAASKREWFGKTAKVYRNVDGKPGELIGVYTIEDTGGRPIRNGSVIDIWLPTEDECFQFGRKLVLVEIK